MVLPLNLAMTAAEMSAADTVPPHCAWMACHFSPCSQGLANVPETLPKGAMLILNDRFPCQGHSPDLVAWQLAEAVARLECESVLLDFQRPEEPESAAMVHAVMNALSCPVGVSEAYAKKPAWPVFLSPAPLHMELREWLAPWQGRQIWLEAALCQEFVSVTEKGTIFTPQFPTDHLDGGFFDKNLCCNYRTEIRAEEIRFTLYDTPASLEKKLKKAHSLGVTRAVGLYQELHAFIKV